MNKPTQLNRRYYYRPCLYDNGATFKCAGHGAEDAKHLAFYRPYFDSIAGLLGTFLLKGVVILQGYHGDKITREYAAEHSLTLAE